MSGKVFGVVLAAAAAFGLGACGATTPPAQPETAEPQVGMTSPPIPVLKVGDPFVADLQGGGQATITVAAAEVADRAIPGDAPSSEQHVRLVVTVKILLDKAGNPITGGPRNFAFLDQGKNLREARTSKDAFPPELIPVELTSAGQEALGRVFFDVPPDLVAGGDIQLMTGRLVHAIWRV